MKKGLLIVLAVVVVAGGAAAFVAMSGKDNEKKDTNGGSSATSSDNSSNDEQAVATTSVEISGMAFSPAAITVKKGSTVTWTNKDSVPHTVTGDESGNMDSDSLAKDDTYQFTFDQKGTFTYHCNFHSNMTGKVIVTE